MPVMKYCGNRIRIRGKVAGILERDAEASVIRILCVPEILTVRISGRSGLRLNDEVVISGEVCFKEFRRVDKGVREFFNGME